MSVTTINLCGTILLKSVKMHFLVIPKFWGFKKSTKLFTGFKIHFFLKIGTPEIAKKRFSEKKKESEIIFFEEKCEF